MRWILSFHIIFVVCWFAGLFYLPRLFVYHAETKDSLSNKRSSTVAELTLKVNEQRSTENQQYTQQQIYEIPQPTRKVEVNSETDFVARDALFVDFANNATKRGLDEGSLWLFPLSVLKGK